MRTAFYLVLVLFYWAKPSGLLHSVSGDLGQLDLLIEILASEEKQLKAVLFAGADNIADTLEKALQQRGIPLLNTYRDHYVKIALKDKQGFIAGEGYSSEPGSTLPCYWDKSVVICPSTKEVILFSGRSGFVQLN